MTPKKPGNLVSKKRRLKVNWPRWYFVVGGGAALSSPPSKCPNFTASAGSELASFNPVGCSAPVACIGLTASVPPPTSAVAAAAGLLADSRPALQRAAVQALGRLCDPDEGAAALRTAAQSKDESVSVAASMATEHCQHPH